MTARNLTSLDSRAVVAAAALIAAAATMLSAPSARAEAPWQQATEVQDGLFEAQADILLNGGASAAREVGAARAAVAGRLERQLAASSPVQLEILRDAIADAERAASSADQVALAAARGRALAALRHGAFDVAVDATGSGEVAKARGWLLIRDFRQATRFTRPGVDATSALDALERGELSVADAVTGVRKDLLDAYQARLVTYLDEASQADERNFDSAFAENAALAAGYWQFIASEYEAQRDTGARKQLDAVFAGLAAAAARGDSRAYRRARNRAVAGLDGFTAAPFTPEEQSRRAHQLTRFLDLIPVEYGRGVSDGEVTLAFEIQEAVAFTEAAKSAFSDIESPLQEADPEGVRTVNNALDELDQITAAANEGAEVASVDEVESVHDEASDALDEMMPDEWKDSDTEADFDLVVDQPGSDGGRGRRR